MQEISTNNESATWRGSTAGVALRLLRFCGRGEAPAISLGLAFLFLGTVIALLQPWPMKLVIDSVINGQPAPSLISKPAHALNQNDPRLAMLVLLCAAQLLLQLLIAALSIAATYFLVAVGLRMVFKLRCALFEKIQRLSLRFHDNTSVGDSIYRVAWDSYSLQAIFNSGLIPALTALLTLLGVGSLLSNRDWHFS